MSYILLHRQTPDGPLTALLSATVPVSHGEVSPPRECGVLSCSDSPKGVNPPFSRNPRFCVIRRLSGGIPNAVSDGFVTRSVRRSVPCSTIFGQGGTCLGSILTTVCGVLVRQFRVFGEDTYRFAICVILRVTGSAVSAELSSIRTNSGTAGQPITTTLSEVKARDRSSGQKSI